MQQLSISTSLIFPFATGALPIETVNAGDMVASSLAFHQHDLKICVNVILEWFRVHIDQPKPASWERNRHRYI